MCLLKSLSQPVKKIIIDWSTFKFFKGEYHFTKGNIINILFNLLEQKGEFYSDCCFYGSTIDKGKYIPFLPTYSDIPSSDKLIKLIISDEETNTERQERVYRDYIPHFIENVKKDTIARFDFEGLIKVDRKEDDTYPILNSKREYPYRYFKLTKK